MKKISENDTNKVVTRYTERYNRHGYSPLTLGWDKGKQEVRFEVLTSQINLSNKRIIDIGCGFGDLNITLQNKFVDYSYFGIDIVPDLIKEANVRYSTNNIKFSCADFLNFDFKEHDYAIASGIFNFRLDEGDNYSYINSVIQKALNICTVGVAFDFLSDRVDYQYEHTFHSSPMRILEIAYQYSRNVILRNDYMPFEFAIFISKNDQFNPKDTLFIKE